MKMCVLIKTTSPIKIKRISTRIPYMLHIHKNVQWQIIIIFYVHFECKSNYLIYFKKSILMMQYIWSTVSLGSVRKEFLQESQWETLLSVSLICSGSRGSYQPCAPNLF